MKRQHDLASPAFKAAPYEYWRLLRQTGPVHRVKLSGAGFAWLITRYEDAVRALGNPLFAKDPLRAKGEAGSRPPWLPGPLQALSRNMMDVHEPDHRGFSDGRITSSPRIHRYGTSSARFRQASHSSCFYEG